MKIKTLQNILKQKEHKLASLQNQRKSNAKYSKLQKLLKEVFLQNVVISIFRIKLSLSGQGNYSELLSKFIKLNFKCKLDFEDNQKDYPFLEQLRHNIIQTGEMKKQYI